VQQTLQVIERLVGKENVEITSAFVGVQPSSYPVNTIYLWTSGPHEAVILTKLKKGAGGSLEVLKERIREEMRQELPEVAISFEPADLVDQVMSLGAPTPIEIAVTGKNLAQGRQFAAQIKTELEKVPYLRDVQFVQPLDYPTFNIEIDRERAGQLGLTVADISQSLVAATSSSRFTQPNYFLDPTSGTAYQVQVEVPQALMNDMAEVGGIPVRQASHSGAQVREAVTVTRGTSVGEYDRLNQQRMVTLSANTHQKDLGSASKSIHRAIQNAGEPPAGLKVVVRGQVELLGQTLQELEMGLGLAIVVIFLMLTANFQSFKVSLSVLSTIPAVVAGSLLLLLLTGSTLNIQSFMGMIMSLGVSIANAILFVTYAEQQRRETGLSADAAMASAATRLRPILMTSLAMIAGMIPLSLGLGEGGEQTAPLAIAVIGGLTASTFAALLLLPLVYASIQRNASIHSVSLDPEDPESVYGDLKN
jgi:multidrug efflux pump subunit AcrB